VTRPAKSFRAQRRILAASRKLFVREPPSTKTFRSIANACGVTVAELRSRYGQPAALYRSALLGGFIEAAMALRDFPRLDPGAPRSAAQVYAAHLAATFRSPAYLELAILIIRDRNTFAWLPGEHRQCVLKPAAFNFARMFDPAIRAGDLPPSINEVEAAVERLQREVVLPRLAPPRPDPREPDDARAVEAAAAALIAAMTVPAESYRAISA
jgi:AcrR family transcriptional regulator